ncbi:MAG: DUF2796 domain-containing protein [Deltaproteobacteria bacterium]|jgi:hypothetical protein|nr:DUF2796 domain-containing protein [Deltaproteobacteria bacterium]
MKKKAFFLHAPLWAILVLISPAGAHEHGAARMNVAADGDQVSISLESPLENLLPFEHVPTTPEQRKQVADMARRMHGAETLFQLTPAAQCRLEKVRLASEKLDPALLDPHGAPEAVQADGEKDPSGKGKKAGKEEHGDLDADFLFMCAKAEKLAGVEVLLFAEWPGLKKIEVQAVTPKGQRAARLTATKRMLTW